MTYQLNKPKTTSILKIAAISISILLLLGLAAVLLGARYLSQELRPVSSVSTQQSVVITAGMSTHTIAETLQKQGLIRSAAAFEWYVRTRNAGRYLQAGTYNLSPNQTGPEIVTQLTHGKVATKLVTITPGLRLDQVKASLMKQGYSESEVTDALDPTQYEALPVLASKPKGASLEGYLYPDSFERTADTKLSTIIEQSLNEMQHKLTPDILDGFSKQGLTTYQGITLASVVEQEVTRQQDRAQAAQVFLSRLKQGIPLGSDVTAFYGSETTGHGKDVTYDTPYNTRLHPGLPPGPISNVSTSSLTAVAHPANTDWLFFVTGDDGVTHFSHTQAEHDTLTQQYCHKLCQM